MPYCVLNDRIVSTQFISQFQALVAAFGSQIHVDEFRKSRIDSLPFIVLYYTVDRMQMDTFIYSICFGTEWFYKKYFSTLNWYHYCSHGWR